MNSVRDTCPILVRLHSNTNEFNLVSQKEPYLLQNKLHILTLLTSASPFISIFQEKTTFFIFDHF